MGFGKTNYNNINKNGNSGSGGQSSTADLPTHLKSLSIAGGNKCATLTLVYSNTDFVSGVRVCYKTGSYPTNPEDGSYIDTDGAATSIKITELTNANTYYFRVFLYNTVDDTKYFQTDITNAEITAMPNSVYIEGITPKEIGENYILLTESGTFTLYGSSVTIYLVGGGTGGAEGYSSSSSTPNGTVFIYSGGDGGYGGKLYSFNIDIDKQDSCTISIGTASSYVNTPNHLSNTTITFKNDNITYTSSSGTYKAGGESGFVASGAVSSRKSASNGEDGILTPIGYVGSSGGGGVYDDYLSYGKGGTGAGNGGNGKTSPTNATGYGCGGGGSNSRKHGGSGMQGCVIITWEN